ncbi:putative WD domain, G-beta repeat-containing protein [Neospora caninum Liverpool]|nr:putative WD domain, G-beta repeat-containing protein [Neospora caninum Liverpool]CBZ52555.1 putative WD domain, G-beta repeat-containing protein [Neospora caninum Liverpool]|eukprot:XP_003882587.1 putative WD domain, G-beta repeat-containing protein [Neospora caninum Liverpool]
MTAGYDGFLRLWSLQTLREVVALSSVSPVASLLEPSPLVRFLWANAFACAGSKAGDLKVWDVNAGRLVCTSLSRPRAGRHAGGVASLRLWASPACGETGPVPLLFSGGVRDGQLCVWDLRAFSSPVATLHAHAGSLNEILFMADAGADACTLGADGACRFWDLRSASFAGAAPGETRAATRAAPHALLREICLGGPQHGFLCGEVAGRGSVCGGSGDGAVYCLSAAGDKEDSRKSESRVNALEMRGLRWKLACDANGAVQVLRAVVTPENAAVGIKQDGLGTGRERREIVHGLVAGGDDGQLSFIGFE